MTYYPQLKTTNAEMKALHNIYRNNHKVLVPILQITKPRITQANTNDSLNKHIDKIMKTVGENRTVVVGITNNESFQDADLSQYILDSSNGYEAWRTRLRQMKNKYTNNNIIPCVVGTPNASILKEYQLQISELSDEFKNVAIRIPVSCEDNFQVLPKLAEKLLLKDLSKNSLILFDFEYIHPQDDLFKPILEELETEIKSISLENICIPLFSSCPSFFPIKIRKSLKVYDTDMIEYDICKIIKKSNVFSYGDYGYIHPHRLEGGGFWYPRVDYPSIQDNKCFYSRYFNKETRRVNNKLRINTTTTNEEAYLKLSKEIIESNFYKNDQVKSWGRSQLNQNTELPITGKSPQHYISIRSNIHLEHILSILKY